ncbi:MAG: AbrB/MazE/SpoVT family DNA-binding domain-containing protein [Defluviitaleaceae bacterium]|nr:AbrB/MazE/SpoVT family DNA-binding domain-containing protein [Defluviitaleaceae bacterium]
MIKSKETRVTQWGPSLGVRLPKEIADSVGIKNKSMVRVELKYAAFR